MNTNIVIIVILLLVGLYLNSRIEHFDFINIPKKTLVKRCNNSKNYLGKLRSMEKDQCNEAKNDTTVGRDAINVRSSCRQFVDKDIFMTNNTEAWCHNAGVGSKVKDANLKNQYVGYQAMNRFLKDSDLDSAHDDKEINFPFDS